MTQVVDALRETLLTEPILHAVETPGCRCWPRARKTHKPYLWAYAATTYAWLKAVIYDFAPGRGGQHARDFLDEWGKLVRDEYSGYKQSSPTASPRAAVSVRAISP